jgi:hypothetical protein
MPSAAAPTAFVWAGASEQLGGSGADLGATVANTATKIGFAVTANDFGGVQDGGAPVTDASVTMPSAATNFCFGNYFGDFGYPGTIHLYQVTYLKRRATNGELQTRTA